MVLRIYKNGSREWRNQKGQLHRLDGPACEYANGEKCWYINGIQYTEEEFNLMLIP